MKRSDWIYLWLLVGVTGFLLAYIVGDLVYLYGLQFTFVIYLTVAGEQERRFIARTTLVAVCICLLMGFTATRLHVGEYYIYRDSKGVLVISNQKPPPGSKIIKQQTLLDTAEGETTLVQDGNETRPNATPSKPSNKE